MLGQGGFSFENHLRNTHLASKSLRLPKATSTGTTIVGCMFDGGIVLGADTRATEGPIVADKNCEKVRFPRLLMLTRAGEARRWAASSPAVVHVVTDASTPCFFDTQIHYISDNIRCCGAGTAADTELYVAITLVADDEDDLETDRVCEQHDGSDLFQHVAALSHDRTTAYDRDGDDDAQANALPVRFDARSPCASLLSDALGHCTDTKATLALRLFWAALTRLARTCTPSLLTARQTSCRT